MVRWLAGLPGPVRACCKAGPTGLVLYRAAMRWGSTVRIRQPELDELVHAGITTQTILMAPEPIKISPIWSIAEG